MLKAPVAECLELASPVSKRKLRGAYGYSAAQFEAVYAAALQTSSCPWKPGQCSYIDDVCTEGSTLRVTARTLKAANPGLRVIAATAGQMTVRAAVRDVDALLV